MTPEDALLLSLALVGGYALGSIIALVLFRYVLWPLLDRMFP